MQAVCLRCRGFDVRCDDSGSVCPGEAGRHRRRLGAFSEHGVEVKEGTRLAAILGGRHDAVQSSHHQGVGRVCDGLVETAWAEDGSLEGLEDPDKRFAVAVLWHPEMEDDKRLFEALVDEARQFARERRDPRPVAVHD